MTQTIDLANILKRTKEKPMSILIKGIDMPKEGEHILALIKNDGKCSYFEETTLSRIMKTTEAIQIPTPHGRLIDRDDIYIGRWDIDSDLAEQIQNAPTILEEE